MIRLLLVEDSTDRYAFFKEHLLQGMRLVWARSGGAALTILARDEPEDYAGVMLDFNLHQQQLTSMDRFTCGDAVAVAVARKLFPETSVLVHSMNPSGAVKMASLLKNEGFTVTRVPFTSLTKERLVEWYAKTAEKAYTEGLC